MYVSHEKNPRIRSTMKSWLFKRDPYFMDYCNPHIIWVKFTPLQNPKQPWGPFFHCSCNTPIFWRPKKRLHRNSGANPSNRTCALNRPQPCGKRTSRFLHSTFPKNWDAELTKDKKDMILNGPKVYTP